jgi:hypothetical protein
MIFPFPDIVGDGAVHQLTTRTDIPTCNTLQIVATGTAGLVARIGGAATGVNAPSATQGIPVIANGGGQFFPPRWGINGYTAAGIFVFVPAGVTISGAAIT